MILVKNLKHIVFLLALVWQAHLLSAQDTIPLNSNHSFKATFQPGYTYLWWYTNKSGVRTDFASTSNKTEEVFWGTEGDYNLFSQAKDANNCLSEIITKKFVVYKNVDSLMFTVYAGRDTVIGNCKLYQLNALVEKQPGETYSYLWKPTKNLDNPAVSNPVFTPASTTSFVVTVTNNKGATATDSVKITVSEILADAGKDVYMELGSTTILDGTNSIGSGLIYYWRTITGKIESGQNTASPIISGFGAYYLEVTDNFGCLATDSVIVTQLAQTPVANDDYDTTSFRTEVKVLVLDNDTGNSIVPSSMTIVKPPASGTAYVDFNDFTIHYRPNNDFSGSDNFEYRICNAAKICDNATVFVMVNDFKFIIPDAFTPNGDGINDFFKIIGIENYQGNSITIVNRWGNMVYQAKNYGIDTNPVFWDGFANTGSTFLGNELPSGTYYYKLDLGNGESPIAGSIYLDR